MTALKAAEVRALLKKRPAHVHVALFHGPDQGLVREHAAALGKQVVDDLNDPFNAMEFGDGDLESPGQLLDEAMALSFMGGERLIRVRGGGDVATKAVKALLTAIDDESAPRPNALVVIEAGELKKTAALRKACEASRHAAAVACYAEDGRSLSETIRDALSAEGLEIEDDALMALAARLGEDRGITRSEIEKLILFMGPASVREGNATVTVDDIRAGLTEASADSAFEIVEMAMSGDPGRLSAALYRARGAGVSLLGVLRILQNKLVRVLAARRMVAEGQPPHAAMKALRPPVFFGEQKSFERQLDMWSVKGLEAIVADLVETDTAAKRTGAPQNELVERALLRLALTAKRARQH